MDVCEGITPCKTYNDSCNTAELFYSLSAEFRYQRLLQRAKFGPNCKAFQAITIALQAATTGKIKISYE